MLTAAVAEAILSGRPYCDSIWEGDRRYPRAGYGPAFIEWLLFAYPRPYNSWGNGSAMRASPVASQDLTPRTMLSNKGSVRGFTDGSRIKYVGS